MSANRQCEGSGAFECCFPVKNLCNSAGRTRRMWPTHPRPNSGPPCTLQPHLATMKGAEWNRSHLKGCVCLMAPNGGRNVPTSFPFFDDCGNALGYWKRSRNSTGVPWLEVPLISLFVEGHKSGKLWLGGISVAGTCDASYGANCSGNTKCVVVLVVYTMFGAC